MAISDQDVGIDGQRSDEPSKLIRGMGATSQSEFRTFLLSEIANVKRGMQLLAATRENADDEIVTAIHQYAG